MIQLAIEYFVNILIATIQFTVFSAVWIIFLIGLFLNTRSIVKKYCSKPNFPYLHNFIALGVTSSILFQLLKMYHSLETQRKSMQNRGVPLSCHTHIFLSRWISSSCEEYYQAVDGKSLLWQLNVFNVVTHFISDIASVVCRMLGHCFGGFIASFLEELPWVIQFVALLIVAISVFSLGFAIFGYKFTLGYGFLTLSRDSDRIFDKCKSTDIKAKPVTNQSEYSRLPQSKDMSNAILTQNISNSQCRPMEFVPKLKTKHIVDNHDTSQKITPSSNYHYLIGEKITQLYGKIEELYQKSNKK